MSLSTVEERIAAACAKAGRKREHVTLIAVSKLQSIDSIRAVYDAGARHFGENYAVELSSKSVELAALPDVCWHAIGALQTNKAKHVAKSATYFHALDRIEIARALSKRRTGNKLICFLEVNVAGEATKSGVAPSDAQKLLDEVRELPNLDVQGVMGLPPPSEDPRRHFDAIATLARSLQLPLLSIGTTADFEVAIEAGATHVRIGTAIFGARPQGQ